MLGQSGHDFVDRYVESLAHAKQREYSYGAPRLDHLPMANAESVANHVFLSELPLLPQRPNTVTQRAEETAVVRRKFGGTTHSSTLVLHEQKHHEQKCVLCGNLQGQR